MRHLFLAVFVFVACEIEDEHIRVQRPNQIDVESDIETETFDTETIETETVFVISTDAETVETETADTVFIETETVDTETFDTETIETETIDSETVFIEPTDIETVDTEPTIEPWPDRCDSRADHTYDCGYANGSFGAYCNNDNYNQHSDDVINNICEYERFGHMSYGTVFAFITQREMRFPVWNNDCYFADVKSDWVVTYSKDNEILEKYEHDGRITYKLIMYRYDSSIPDRAVKRMEGDFDIAYLMLGYKGTDDCKISAKEFSEIIRNSRI